MNYLQAIEQFDEIEYKNIIKLLNKYDGYELTYRLMLHIGQVMIATQMDQEYLNKWLQFLQIHNEQLTPLTSDDKIGQLNNQKENENV